MQVNLIQNVYNCVNRLKERELVLFRFHNMLPADNICSPVHGAVMPGLTNSNAIVGAAYLYMRSRRQQERLACTYVLRISVLY